jgi:hypothetical protein
MVVREGLFLVFLLLCFLPHHGFSQIREGQKTNLDQVIANVGERIITKSDTRFWMFQLRHSQEELRQSPDEILMPLVLRDMIEEHLLYEHFWNVDIEPSEDELRKLLDETYAQRIEKFGSRERLISALEIEDLTLSGYRQWLKGRLEQEFVIDQGLFEQIDLEAPETGINYASAEVAEIELREVFIKAESEGRGTSSELTESDWNSAKGEIIQARIRINEGMSFSEAARVYSHSSLAADDGGYLGWVEFEDLSDEVREELGKTRVGTMTSPLKMESGFSLFFVEGIRTKEAEAYRETRQRIRQRILKELVEAHDVHILPRYDLTVFRSSRDNK